MAESDSVFKTLLSVKVDLTSDVLQGLLQIAAVAREWGTDARIFTNGPLTATFSADAVVQRYARARGILTTDSGIAFVISSKEDCDCAFAQLAALNGDLIAHERTQLPRKSRKKRSRN